MLIEIRNTVNSLIRTTKAHTVSSVRITEKREKKKEKTYDTSSIKHVTKKFLEVSRCSRAKQRQRNVQKKCAPLAKLLFLLLFFTVLRRCLRSLALHDFIFCLSKL